VAEQPSMMEMMKQARDLQKKMKKVQKRVEKAEITATAADGRVTVVVSGKLNVRRITLEPSLVREGNVRLIEDSIVAAINAAIDKAQEMMTEEMKDVTGGLNIPDLL
jgi:DNA-binding YbaB/EbfC family protein